MRTTRLLIAIGVSSAAAIVSLSGVHTAHAGYTELIVGLGVPLAEDDYKDLWDPSLRLGVRAGTSPRAFVFEGSLDFTLGNFDDARTPSAEISGNRIRMLGGFRWRAPVGRTGTAFVRAGGGIDFTTVRVETSLLPIEQSESDLGLALEFGGGVSFQTGPVYVGGQLALPIGLHFDDETTLVGFPIFDYTAIDLDLLFTLGTNF